MRKRTDRYYHESGHVVLNKLFDETFKIEFVTVDETTSKLQDSKSFGGAKGKYVVKLQDRTVFDHDKAILGFMSGLIVDEIVENESGFDATSNNVDYYILKLNNEHKYSGDRDLIGSTFSYIRDSIPYSFQEYLDSCVAILFRIFNNEIVWHTVSELRNKLKTKHTLDSSEIDFILYNTGFDRWKEEFKASLNEDRVMFLSN